MFTPTPHSPIADPSQADLLINFSTLFNLLPIGAYRSSPDGRQLRANRALVALNGFDSEAEMLSSVNDIAREWYVDPQRRAEFADLMRRDGSVSNFVSEIYCYKSRKRIWICEHAHAVHHADQSIAYYEGTVEDISEQHTAHLAAQKERSLLLELIHNIPDAVWMINEQGEYQVCNCAYIRRFGRGNTELIGKTAHDLFPKPDADRFRAADLDCIASGQVTQSEVNLVDTQTGNNAIFLVVKLPIYSLDGACTGVIGLARDITQEQQTQKALRAAKENAEQIGQAKAEFLANMSHEIRTPLNAVVGIGELLLNTRLSGEQRELVRTIQSSSEALMALVNDILDFSKIDAGKMALEHAPFDVAQTIKTAMDMVATQANAKGLKMALELDNVLPPLLMGDGARFRQVMLNLLNNAVKFTALGQVTVHAAYTHSGGNGPILSVGVSDTGIGIAPEQIHMLFKVFSQVDASTTRRFGGSGLGLAISQRIVELMGGTIGVESHLGLGSEFSFDVPLAPAPAPAAEPPAALPTHPVQAKVAQDRAQVVKSPLRLLVAEDNRVNQMVIGRILKSLGYEAHMVANGQEALDAIALASQSNAPIQAVLMDVQMPEMDGLQAASHLRDDARFKNARPWVIAMTANAMDGDREHCLAAGMHDYVSKPISIALFTAALKKAETVAKAAQNSSN